MFTFCKSIHWTTEINLPSKPNLLASLLASLPDSGLNPDRTKDVGSYGKHHTFPDPLNSSEKDIRWYEHKKIITGHCRICFVNNRCSKPFSWLAGSF